MNYQFDFSFLHDYWPELLNGAQLTLLMSCTTIVLGFVMGIIFAILRTYGSKHVQRIVGAYVDVIRNTPLVVQSFWLFFGLAAIEVRIPALTAAIIALTINVTAYTTEIIRAGIESIPRGQVEAAACLGMSRNQMLRMVVLPQAIERMYPSLISQFVLMMLATSIMSQISIEELTGAGYGIQSITFRGFEVYLIIAAIYLVLSWLLRWVMEAGANLAFARRRRLNTPL